MNSRFEGWLIVLLLLPLTWIHSPSAHDWGGDFAAYIAQAENILSALPPDTTGYVYNPDYYRLAPPSYPPGFSLLLTPVIALFGSGIGGLITFMSVLSVAFGWAMFVVLRARFSLLIAAGVTLLTLYNPWFLVFKTEVIADLPFALFVLLSVLTYRWALNRNRWYIWLIVGLVVAWTTLIKTHGVVVLAAMVVDTVVRFVRHRNIGESLHVLLVALPFAVLVYLLVDRLWLPAPADHLGHFGGIAAERGGFFSSVLPNLDGYIQIYQNFFVKDLGNWTFIGRITSAVVVVFAVIGLIYRWFFARPHLEDWVLAGLMAALLLFPITNGFRYLLPAFPFLFGYTACGLQTVRTPEKLLHWAPRILIVLLAAQYSYGWVKVSKLPEIPEGPYHEKYHSLHEQLRQLPENALLIAAKPRVFAYLDEVRAASIRPDATHAEFTTQINRLRGNGPVYLLSIRATPHERIDAEVLQEGGNEAWVLVKYRNESAERSVIIIPE